MFNISIRLIFKMNIINDSIYTEKFSTSDNGTDTYPEKAMSVDVLSC